MAGGRGVVISLGEGGTSNVLSDAERRVASLAALGFSNREIASKLYITVSTVEQHLTRVYRKLRVRNRRDLTTWTDLDAADQA